jgi:hypothetical protein
MRSVLAVLKASFYSVTARLETTVRYRGIGVDDALETDETEV